MGLIPIFPGGANVTGNIAITLVLALCTFVLTNVYGTKAYWKEIFWPDVPTVINGSMTVVSVAFSIFMDALEILVAFIQAYVFTMLSAVFIGLSQVKEHAEK